MKIFNCQICSKQIPQNQEIIFRVLEDGGEHHFHTLLVPVYINSACLVDNLIIGFKFFKEFII